MTVTKKSRGPRKEEQVIVEKGMDNRSPAPKSGFTYFIFSI